MQTDTSANKTDDAQAAAENLAHRAGTAAQRVGEAAKSAGKQVGAVASEELRQSQGRSGRSHRPHPQLIGYRSGRGKGKADGKSCRYQGIRRDVADNAREQFDHGVECSRDYVKERPLQSVGYAAAIGFLLGLLITRR